MKAFKFILPLVAIAAVLSTDIRTVQAQRGGGNSSILMLAMREDVQKEIDLVEDQIEELGIIRDEYRDEIRNQMREFRDNGGGGDMNSMREKVRELSGEFTEKAEEVFLEEQLKRLKEIAFQSNMSRNPAETLKERFDLSDEQIEKFAEARQESREKAEKEIAEIMLKYQDEALSVLPEEVQSEIKEARGEMFAQSRDSGQRGGGQRGGAGGQRGGGQRGGGGGQRGGGQRGGGQRGGGDSGRPQSDF